MDKLDTRILRAINNAPTFQWDVRASYAKLAESVGVDPETVRTRLLRLEASGVMRGWDVVVNPSLFGRVVHRAELPGVPEADKGTVIEQVSLVDGVHKVFDLYRGGLAVVGYFPPGPSLQRTTELLASIAGTRAELWPITMPPGTVELTPTDWRLVAAMRAEPRGKLAAIAEHAGVSPRTARRRIDRLVAGRAATLMFVVDFEHAEGAMPTEVRVIVSDDKAREGVAKQLLDRDDLVFASVGGPLMIASYNVANLRALDGLQRALAATDGVDEVRCDVIARLLTVGRWLDEQIAAKLDPVA